MSVYDKNLVPLEDLLERYLGKPGLENRHDIQELRSILLARERGYQPTIAVGDVVIVKNPHGASSDSGRTLPAGGWYKVSRIRLNNHDNSWTIRLWKMDGNPLYGGWFDLEDFNLSHASVAGS